MEELKTYFTVNDDSFDQRPIFEKRQWAEDYIENGDYDEKPEIETVEMTEREFNKLPEM